jgi:type IV fimbrial biogenesis protein FimT
MDTVAKGSAHRLGTGHGGLPPQVCLRGFTLIEALVVMALLALLLGLAVPGVSGWRARQQLQASAENFWNGLMLARSQALLHQQHVTMCAVSSAGVCDVSATWSSGWQVFLDGNRNGQREPAERLLLERAQVPGSVFITGNSTVAHTIGYGADGRSEQLGGGFLAGTVSVCSAGQAQGWRLVINAVGRPRLEKAAVTDCP